MFSSGSKRFLARIKCLVIFRFNLLELTFIISSHMEVNSDRDKSEIYSLDT